MQQPSKTTRTNGTQNKIKIKNQNMFNHSIKIVQMHKKQNKCIKLNCHKSLTTTLNTIKFICYQITKHTSITLLLRLIDEVRP